MHRGQSNAPMRVFQKSSFAPRPFRRTPLRIFRDKEISFHPAVHA
jgi:hypothetical protein